MEAVYEGLYAMYRCKAGNVPRPRGEWLNKAVIMFVINMEFNCYFAYITMKFDSWLCSSTAAEPIIKFHPDYI